MLVEPYYDHLKQLVINDTITNLTSSVMVLE